MKNKGLLIVIVLIVVICGGGGLAYKQMAAARAAADATTVKTAKVTRGDLELKVVESGTLDAVKAVEVKSRVSGRLAQLLVEEGDRVEKGQLIAVIDPKETQLQVERDSASLSGAQSGAARAAIDIAQRKVTAKEDLVQARARVAQLELELGIQPTLTTQAIQSAQTAYNTASQAREQLVRTTQPLERTGAETELREATSSHTIALNELKRRQELLAKGFVAQRSVEEASLQVDQVKARLARAQDKMDRLDMQQKLELQQADERVRQANTDLERAKANRIQDSVKRKEFETAQSAVRKAEIALRDVEALSRSRDQQLASVRQLQSVVSESQRQLGETEIRAPISGIVTQKLVQEGELVASISGFSAGSTIVRIEDRGQLMVKLDINEIDVARIATGMPASIQVDALPDTPLSGKVAKIAPSSRAAGAPAQQSADAVVKYEVEIWLDSAPEGVRSGMSAKCTLIPKSRKGVLQLPAEFVGEEKGEHFVEFAAAKDAKDKKPRRQIVTVGLTTGSRIEILTGVKEGDEVSKPEYKGPARKGMMQAGGGGDEEPAKEEGS